MTGCHLINKQLIFKVLYAHLIQDLYPLKKIHDLL